MRARDEESLEEATKKKPALASLWEYEHYTLQHLDKPARDYYLSGAADMITLRENRSVYSDYHVIPRVLRGSDCCDLTVSLAGMQVRSPVAIAPWAMQVLTPDFAHHLGHGNTADQPVIPLSSL